MDKFGHARRKSFACAASVNECKEDTISTANYIYLREPVVNKVENQDASAAGGLNFNQYSSSCEKIINISRTSWPELTKSVTFQRHGSKSKSAKTTVGDQQVIKEGIRRGTEMKKVENVSCNASKSYISNSVLTVQGNVSDVSFQATSYSCKAEVYTSVQESCVNNSGAGAELEKCSVKDTRQVRQSSRRKPKTTASICNRTDEFEEYTICGGVSGAAYEQEQLCDDYLDTTGTSRVFSDSSSGKMPLVFRHLQKTDLPQTSLKEQSITIDELSNALNARKSNQRKKAWKEEKKRLREEEIRRRMVAPKGQTVRVVSQKVLEELLKSKTENVSCSTYETAIPGLNEKEFPTVDESRKLRMGLNEAHPCGIQHIDVKERIPSCETQVKLTHVGSDSGDCVKLSTVEEEIVEAANRVSVRKRKTKDPIHINLLNLIKTQPSRHNKAQGEKGSVSKVVSRTKKRDDVIRYSGNQLDASYPERKRGKKREVPKKKKISVLKSAILGERALRRQLHAFQEESGRVDLEDSGVTVDSSACVNDSVVSGAEEMRSCLCVTETGEVTGDNGSKVEGVNITEVLNLTESLQENLTLGSSHQASALSENVSSGPESTEKMIHKVERGEGNGTVTAAGLFPHGCTEEVWRLPVHSRKFREYCDNCVTVPLNSAVKLLLKDIVKFQDRLYHRDPVKAFAKRRYVLGFREVMKCLCLKKLKLIVIAPDLEVAKQKGGIDDSVAQLKEESAAQGLPCLFALSRRELGYLTFKKIGVSCIGICSYEGSESNFIDVMDSLAGARTAYEQKTQHAVTMQNVSMQTTDGATDKPDSSTDETTTLTNQVIASLLSKLTENSSGDSASRLLSAIEGAPSLE